MMPLAEDLNMGDDAQAFAGETTGTPEAIAASYETYFQQALKEGDKAADPGLKALHAFLKEKFGPFRAPANFRRYYPADVREQLTKLDQELKDLETAMPKFPQAMGIRENAAVADIPDQPESEPPFRAANHARRQPHH